MPKNCEIPGCEEPQVARGWCNKHYKRWKHQGSASYIPQRLRSHGQSQSKTYAVWAGMKARCHNPNENSYPRYGGRGITVCERWQAFENFFADIGEKPEGLSLDRINTNGNYEPENCRWATIEEQNNNTRVTLQISFRGQVKSAAQWSRILKIDEKTIAKRHKRGVPIDVDMRTIRPKQTQEKE